LTADIESLLLIRRGERNKVTWFLLFFLLVSAGMAVGRGTADALFQKRLGIEYLPVMYLVRWRTNRSLARLPNRTPGPCINLNSGAGFTSARAASGEW
jgi:hypothetical protein